MASSSPSSPEITAATGAEAQEPRFSYKHATHEEVLEDLSSRFILNLPDEELASLERICFQVEQAHWFYEDFVREQNPNFPSLPLKKFSAMLFQACPLLHQWSHDHEQAFNTFMQYKTRVPVCGAIMLNDTWEKCLLVKGWKSSSGWGFPKGKINEDEPPPTCAVREVLEETGYNLAGKINPSDVIEMSIREQKISLFIVPGVPEDFPFKTKTRKEISKIEWFKLTDLPTWKRNKGAPGKFYLISPFISALKTFINERKPRGVRRKPKTSSPYHSPNESAQESSSQSSSADNGDPQTPSPQYSAPIVNSDPHAMDLRPGLATQSMDPHFARLLSSLTLSATASGKEADTDEAKLHVVAAPTVGQTSPSNRRRFSRSHSARKPSLDVQPMAPLSETGSTFIMQRSDKHDTLQAPVSPVAQSLHATLRRTSSIADISPYLSRPSEPPTSAKQLKQLALLETVADESAKISNALIHNNNPILPAAPGQSTPMSPPRLLKLSASPRSSSHHISSSISFHHRSPLLGSTGALSMASHSALPVRSQTSHAMYSGLASTPHSGLNMTQPYPSNDSRLIPEFPRTPGQMQALAPVTSNGNYPLPRTQLPRPSAIATPAISAHNSTANSLLSILNGKPGQGLPTLPSAYFNARP